MSPPSLGAWGPDIIANAFQLLTRLVRILGKGVCATPVQNSKFVWHTLAAPVTICANLCLTAARGGRDVLRAIALCGNVDPFGIATAIEVDPLRLHPRLAEVYAEKVQQLEKALNDTAIRAEAADVFRSLIDRIELRPGDDGQGIAAALHGDLAQILALCDDSARKRKLPKAETSGSQLSVVAGARSHLYRTRVHYEREAQK